jgi:tetratricopeptide (TPR) repeat protein
VAVVRIIPICERSREQSPRRAPGVRLVAATALIALLSACAQLKGEVGRAGTKNAPYVPAASEALFGNYLAGRFAGSVRDTKRAVRYFDRALQDDPGNAAILDRAFLFEVANGDVEQAIARAEHVVATNPEMRLASLVLALRDVKRGNYAAARQELGQTDNAIFNTLVSRLITAWALQAEGRTDDALIELNRISSVAAFDLFRFFHTALLLERAGRLERADAAYRSALGAGGDGVIRVVDSYGRFLERGGAVQDARALYESFLAQSPDHPLITVALVRLDKGQKPEPMITTTAQGVAEALYDLASALAQDRSVDLPVVYLQLALYLDPEFDVAQALLADLFEITGRSADANAMLARIPRSSPLASHAAIETALNLDRMGQSDAAISTLRGIVSRDPKNLRAIVSLGDLLRSHDRFKESVEAYSRAIAAVDPADKRFWSLYYARGAALERAGLWSEAERDLQYALNLDPDQPLVLNYLGYSWVDRGENLSEALSMIERAVELMPDDGFIVDSLGWAHYRIGNYDLAATYLEHAVSLRPEDPTINDHLGDAYWRVGRALEARFQWRHALALKPDATQVPIIERKLEYGLEEAAPQRASAAAEGSPPPAP